MARLLVRRLTLSVLGFQSSMATLLVSTHFSSENSHLFLWNHRESKLNLWMTFRFVHVAKLEKGCLMKKTKLNANRGGKRTKTLTKKSDNVTEHWSHTTLEWVVFFLHTFAQQWMKRLGKTTRPGTWKVVQTLIIRAWITCLNTGKLSFLCY